MLAEAVMDSDEDALTSTAIMEALSARSMNTSSTTEAAPD
jgi:hypothetical protein